MFKISMLTTAFLISFSAGAQSFNNSPDAIETTFEAYKQCIKSEKRNENAKITKANYQSLCQSELARLKGVAKESYPAIQNIIERWISSMETKSDT